LTLSGVEQASRRFPEPIAIDYLSRLERGTLMPSVPKLATLAHVYQRPLHEFVDLYDLEQLRALVPEQEGDFWHFRKLGIEYGTQGDHGGRPPRCSEGWTRRAPEEISTRPLRRSPVWASASTGSPGITPPSGFSRRRSAWFAVDRIRGYALYDLALAHYHLADLMLSGLAVRKGGDVRRTGSTSRPTSSRFARTIASDRQDYKEAIRLGNARWTVTGAWESIKRHPGHLQPR
jgi:transcriptional regulator with XRE-family HTH domain